MFNVFNELIRYLRSCNVDPETVHVTVEFQDDLDRHAVEHDLSRLACLSDPIRIKTIMGVPATLATRETKPEPPLMWPALHLDGAIIYLAGHKL